MKYPLIVFSFLMTADLVKSQSFSPSHFLEKIYIQTDKQYYYGGETMWLSAFVNYRTAGMADTLSKVLYVDLFNSTHQLVRSLTLKIDSGRASGSIKIPRSYQGTFILRGMTNWLLNYGSESLYYKSIPVLPPHSVPGENTVGDENTGGLKIQFGKETYTTRDKVTMRVVLGSQAKKASIAISVTDESQISQLKNLNPIEANFPASDSLPKSMLTKFIYPIERGIRVQGLCLMPDKKETQIRIIQGEFQNQFLVPVDWRGYFSLDELFFYDSMRFTFQADRAKIILKTRDLPDLPKTIKDIPIVFLIDSTRVIHASDTSNAVQLKEVVVKASRVKTYQNLYQRPDFLVAAQEMRNYTNLAEVVRSKVPGYKLTFSGVHWYLQWNRSEFTSRNGVAVEPIVYVNNSKLLIADPTTDGETVGDRLANMDPSSIDHIEAADMANTNIGATGSIGVLYIFTKPDAKNFKSFPVRTVKGFDRSLHFEAPDYGNPLSSGMPSDYRSTVYWNPVVDVMSTKEISFYTSDQKGLLRVVVEGVTDSGKPIRATARIEVK